MIRAQHSPDTSAAEGYTATSLCALARKLVAAGWPGDEVLVAHTPTGTRSLSGTLRAFAYRYASETEARGPQWRKWTPNARFPVLGGGQDGASVPGRTTPTPTTTEPLTAAV
jgi:hypothetical protein